MLKDILGTFLALETLLCIASFVMSLKYDLNVLVQAIVRIGAKVPAIIKPVSQNREDGGFLIFILQVDNSS